MPDNFICPNCGYQYDESKITNLSGRIRELLAERSEKTRKMINTIRKLIDIYGNITDQRAMVNFLYNIEGIDDKIVNYTIEKFYSEAKYQSKGIAYLGKMITNYEENKDKLRTIERKKYGSKPPRKKVT